MPLPTDRLPSIDDVAAHLDITPASVRKIVRKYRVPVLSTGRHIRFDDIALNALWEALRARSTADVVVPVRLPAVSGRRYLRLNDRQDVFDRVRAKLVEGSRRDRTSRPRSS
ncbi:MAG TPA: hypothetical protein VEW06_06310 [Xanthobacteraceae bacterium]|nr:hypothetical protein [Xanthobacteraceae bacterium]